MSGLMIKYSKEVAKELSSSAVCLPGSPVAPGDIVYFKFGKQGPFWRKRPAPWGSFEKLTSLSLLGIKSEISKPYEDKPTYFFNSSKGISVTFGAEAESSVGDGATLSVKFSKEGSVYFAAVGCLTRRLMDLNAALIGIQSLSNPIAWKDVFVVTSVTAAQRALIMQSASSSGELQVAGQTSALISKVANASTNISIKKSSNSSLFVPWSENVNILFGLHRFSKRASVQEPEDAFIGHSENISDLRSSQNDEFFLDPVFPQDLLEEADYADDLQVTKVFAGE